MSHPTRVFLIFSIIEDDHNIMSEVETFLSNCGSDIGLFKDVTKPEDERKEKRVGGSYVLCEHVYYLSSQFWLCRYESTNMTNLFAFFQMLRSGTWEDEDEVQLLIKDEDDEIYSLVNVFTEEAADYFKNRFGEEDND